MKEKKIREVLKEIFESYDEVYDFIFTTFNYDPDFFEQQIVTYLMGLDKKISKIGELNDANEWIANNHIHVYYDYAALSTGSSCLTVPIYPQKVNCGVFHPKLIIIYGKHTNGKIGANLFVSSCNLTISGYARNKEAFAVIEINTKSVASSLYSFINKLNGNDHLELLSFLKSSQFSDSEYPKFVFNTGEKNEQKLTDVIKKLNGDITIASPYFDSQGIDTLLCECGNSCNTTIIPALDNGKYNLTKTDYNKLSKSGVKFCSLIDSSSPNRFAHAKIIVKGEHTIVGSYNFTAAAMNGKNAEAALIFDFKTELGITDGIDETRLTNDINELRNDDEHSENDKIFVSVTVDWREKSVTIKGLKQGYKVKIGGNTISTDKAMLTEKIEKDMLKNKQFLLLDSNNKIIYIGLINELNWQDARPQIMCENLGEAISQWYYDYENSARKIEAQYELKSIDDSDEERADDPFALEKSGSRNETDIFDNYFLVSSSLCNLLRSIDESKENSKNIYSLFRTSPGSMVNILSFVKEEYKSKNDTVYLWLICQFLKQAESALPTLPDDFVFYKKEKEKFKKNLSSTLKKLEDGLKKDLLNEGVINRSEYLNWIKSQLFEKEENNV